jgi:trimeric autotransporter adhesin
MRKILVSGVGAAALIGGGTAFAQSNQSDVTQSGAGAVATVLQDGSNDRSSITQTGGGTVDVGQTGLKGSTSTVTTSADDRPPESKVTIRQSDTGVAAAATGQANVSTVVQDNVNGFGATGTGSTVDVTQVHDAAGAGQNASYVMQGRNAVSGQVTVSQTGGENISYYSSTTSTDNDADIRQSGVGNNSTVLQNFQGGGAYARVDQTNAAGGAVNTAYIEQVSGGYSTSPAQFAYGADAEIVQNGSDNSSSIVQTGYSATMAQGNTAFNSQTGDSHLSTINQGGIDNSAMVLQSGFDNSSSVLQGGNANIATVDQSSSGNVSAIDQSGNNNTATVTQGGM